MDEGKIWPDTRVKKGFVSAYKEEYAESKPQFWLLITLPLVILTTYGVVFQITLVSEMQEFADKCTSGLEYIVNIGVLIFSVAMLATVSGVIGGLAYLGMTKAVTKLGEYIFKAVIGLSCLCFGFSVLTLIIAVSC